MNTHLSAQDVLNDIEFELVQGAISKDELGRGVAQVKAYQNKLRSDLFQPGQEAKNLREVLARQFQLNDMLLMLLQEMAAANQERLAQTRRQAHRQPSALVRAEVDTAVPAPDNNLWRDTADIKSAIDETLEIKLEARPTNIPLLGLWFHRLKFEMHSLVIFYLRKLGQRQTAVNRTYGEWLLYFDALHQHQDNQLQTRFAELEKRLAAIEKSQ
jgi:hypothetical protein